jgi:hypothetical protein
VNYLKKQRLHLCRLAFVNERELFENTETASFAAFWEEEPMVKLNLRTKSIGTRVSEQEYARLERVAQKASKTLAEWCREVMLNSANGGAAETAVAGARAEALTAEVVALRAILLNVLFKQSNGERLTAEEMQRLVDRADSDKLRKARERLLQAQESEGQRKGKS